MKVVTCILEDGQCMQIIDIPTTSVDLRNMYKEWSHSVESVNYTTGLRVKEFYYTDGDKVIATRPIGQNLWSYDYAAKYHRA